MPTQMLRYQVADEGAAEVASAIEAAFAAVQAHRPDGLRYAYYRRAGSNEFVALLDLAEGAPNPLLSLPALGELRETVAKWAVGEPPAPQPLDLLGSYASAR